MASDDRLRAYLRGELDEGSIALLEGELAAEPELRRELRRLGREQLETLLETPVDDPSESMRATLSVGTQGEAPSVQSLSTSRLQLGELLGKGGMGVVHLGHQPHLGRTVAVKRAKAPGGDEGVKALLSEAFVTGQLEHPNIVPIHDIILTDESEPQVVLKRIEGSAWRALLRDPDEVLRRFEVVDVLEWHLRVLLSVCQALRFAHSRGIVHRDVKPSNVMLGRFGEIYLLDWGLAWRMPSEEDLAADSDQAIGFGGTPAYMAPEQFAADLIGLGPHTDIYLVGATLFEILEGHPPRKGRDLMTHLSQALEGPPRLGPEAPEELATIVRKAMAPDPEDRFASVQDVRNAIHAFLEHRASRRLADKAAKSVEDMEAARRADDDAAGERAFVEATFGYRAALDAWPDNREARDALGDLVQRRIEGALDAGAVETAERLLALGSDLPESLRSRVREAVGEHARHNRELERMAEDQERTSGVGTRRLLVLLVFGSWVAWWIHVGLDYPMSADDMVPGPALITVLAMVGAFAARHRLSSRQNQNLVVASLVLMASTVSWLLAAAQLDIDAALVPLPLPLMWAVGTGVGAYAIDRRAIPSAIAYLVGFLVVAIDLAQIRWVLGITSLFWLLNALVVNVIITRAARDGRSGR